jgi:branched-chain amino acid transport system substrate-binding protein
MSGFASAILRSSITLVLAVAPVAALAQAPSFRIAVVTPLTGPLSVVNLPGQNAIKLVADAINSGTMPAPFAATKGLGGRQIELSFIDENGGNARQVNEFRALVERNGANAVMGFGSAATCLAIAPVAEELKTLTIMTTCASPRVFEDAQYNYVFRTTAHTTMDSAALARYVQARMSAVKTVGHINPNFALGQDAWRDFLAAIKAIKPEIEVVAEQWPTFGSGQYSAELSALAAKRPDIIHTSFAGSDLEAFINQMVPRELHKDSKILAPLLELSMYRMGRAIPDGIVFTARGTNGLFAPASPLNDWFVTNYRERFKDQPVYTGYQYANALIVLKTVSDRIAAAGKELATSEIIAGLTGGIFDTPSGKIRMALGNGHQAIQDTAVGEIQFDAAKNALTVRKVTRFPAECVNPPVGLTSEAWLKSGMAGAKCDGTQSVD